MSIKTIKQVQTAYLARPGFPGLIEVQERKELKDLPLFVDSISLALDPALSGLLKHIGLGSIVKPASSSELSLAGRVVPLKDLF